MYLPGSSWNSSKDITMATDYEPYGGRKKYATQTAGGYYAARLGILEQLTRMKRQASVLVYRFETPDYWAALGVWVVREAMRKTMETRAMTFATREEMIHYGQQLIQSYLKFDLGSIFSKSGLLRSIKDQMKLTQFLL